MRIFIFRVHIYDGVILIVRNIFKYISVGYSYLINDFVSIFLKI